MGRIGDLAIAYEIMSKETKIEILRCSLKTFECQKETFNNNVTLTADMYNFCHFFNGTQNTIKLKAELTVNMADNNHFILATHNARGNPSSQTLASYTGKTSLKNQQSIITLKPGVDLTFMMLGLDRSSDDNATLVLSLYTSPTSPAPAKSIKKTLSKNVVVAVVLIAILLFIVVLTLRRG